MALLSARKFGGGGSPASSVLQLLAGNVAAQMLVFAAYPVLTRLYTPAQIGLLSTLSAAVIVLSPAASARIDMALPMARTEREAGSLLAASAVALVLSAVAIMLLMALLPDNWPGEMAAAAPYRWLLPPTLVALGGYLVMCGEATRQSRFADVALSRVSQAFIMMLCQIGLYFLGFGTVGLLLGLLIALTASTLGLAWRLLRGPESPLRRLRWRAVRAAASRHRHFALLSSWTGVFNAASTYLTTIAFAFLYGPVVSGFLFLGERVVMRPLEMIAGSVAPVYTRDLSRLEQSGNGGQAQELFLRVVRNQALVALVWLLPVTAAAAWVLPWVFGEQWREAVPYLQALAIGYFFTAVLSPVSSTLMILRQQKLLAALDLGRGIAVFTAIAGVALLGLPSLIGVLVCSLSQAVSQLVILWLTWRRVHSFALSTKPADEPDGGPASAWPRHSTSLE